MAVDYSTVMATIVSGAAPLIFASLGETVTERGGVINLSLDGTILLSAMTGFAVAFKTGNVFYGFLAAGIVGAVVAGVVAGSTLFLRVSQVAVGFVLALMCKDLAYFLGNPFSRIQGPQLSYMPIPLLEKIPVIGKIFFQQNVMVYLSYILIFLVWFFLYKTRFGLMLRCSGENPEAAFTRGIPAEKLKFIFTLVGGFLVGLAGALYSLSVKPGWGRPQGAEGIGWIALAIVIFGGWEPFKVALGCYLFSFLQIAGILLQDRFPSVPAQVFQVAPFPLMIFMLLVINFFNKKEVQEKAQTNRFLRILSKIFKATPPASLGKVFYRS
ncbi:ABC transporter permease [Desulfurobacterium atlanticum]|uniref:Nucleoside ABC transporter membrane protein n=1 Tax=Desulfurobacterium atlanticum TaxID=240169 RepID=A0A238XP75_9BACT|nr:ABC transporter permease [Desulfurobacterium atlanticum]SNR60510.1 nucleoside ABC transporter membrane protein [Desulfurobacterium atlanticum]